MSQSTQASSLKRCLNAKDLSMLGIGSIIGAGIFVLTGVAAATQAGPGIIISYLFAGIICVFVALCYAELASALGGCGGAYHYAYASCGKLFAWVIGWALLLQYSMNVATVAVGWSGYVINALKSVGINVPAVLTGHAASNAIINLPAMLIVFLIASILSLGPAGSAKFNTVFVAIKLAVIAVFIGVGSYNINTSNFDPFLPFGWKGVINGTGVIFFSFIGFDAIAAAAEETVDPQRNLPIGILLSLLFCVITYVLIAAVLVGMSNYTQLNNPSPIANALLVIGHPFIAGIIALGAIAGITTSILAVYYALTRMVLAMARDNMLPKFLGVLHQPSATPRVLIWLLSLIIATLAGLLPIMDMANLVNLSTLAIFIAVSSCLLILRITQPQLPRAFKTPWTPLVPMLSIGLCGYVMTSIPSSGWLLFGTWTLVGLIIYPLMIHKPRE